ncbi:MAG: hypothetical protein ABIO24_12295 [Saprospiraceae bacterium]
MAKDKYHEQVKQDVFLEEMENEELIETVIEHRNIHLLVVNIEQKVIVKWIK